MFSPTPLDFMVYEKFEHGYNPATIAKQHKVKEGSVYRMHREVSQWKSRHASAIRASYPALLNIINDIRSLADE